MSFNMFKNATTCFDSLVLSILSSIRFSDFTSILEDLMFTGVKVPQIAFSIKHFIMKKCVSMPSFENLKGC
jgi:hypothetical protein